MKTPAQQLPSGPLHPSIHEALSDAIRFWEPRRIIYNAGLAAVVLVSVTITGWTRIHGSLSFENLLAILVLAVLANACYCTAYCLDIPAQLSTYRGVWLRVRPLLWLFGSLFGMALAWYWMADEILPAIAR